MKLRITLVRSTIARKPDQRRTVAALALRKINQTVELESNDAVRGMVRAVSHLVKVEEV